MFAIIISFFLQLHLTR